MPYIIAHESPLINLRVSHSGTNIYAFDVKYRGAKSRGDVRLHIYIKIYHLIISV